MFSYVAKSLLSKTLKTFLRRYLEDIEFESISYGSNAASGSDAAGNSSSGWGVRLSNVKLREGMELMKLAGKRRRKVVVKKVTKRRKKKKENKPKKIVESVAQAPKQKAHEQQQQQNGAAIRPGRVRRSRSQGSFAAPIPGITTPIHTGNQYPMQPAHKSRPEIRKRSMSNGSDFDYFSSAPSTPVQQRTVICTPLSMCSSSKHKKNTNIDKASDLNLIPALPFDDEDEGVDFQDNGLQSSSSIDMGLDIKLAPDSVFRSNLKTQSTDEESDEYESDDSVIEVEEEHIIEDTMSLVVGAGGVIGTLNIRLAGKELHVTVEDAHLIIEALPVGDVDEQKDEKTSASYDDFKGHQRSDSTVSEASIESIPDAPLSVKNTAFGEKIKAKSIFARYLSMIPHLFLRDCRVSLILPGESDFADDESTTNSVADCTVFECGIDFLSVTSGDDFIDVLRLDTGATVENAAPQSAPLPAKSGPVEGQKHNRNNVFSRKRIRTGKGPEGGLWLKIHPPNNAYVRHRYRRDNHAWARQKYLNSSDGFFFRCSGVDLHARMLIEVTNEVEEEIAAAWSSEYDDYTMDSMLFGVDYVDPISLTRHQIRERMKRERLDDPKKFDAANQARTDTDGNGIQQIPYSSNFHWLAMHTHRHGCPSAYLTLNECNHCWNSCVLPELKEQNKSSMDSKMPLPGFVFCLSVTDAIELNVDRSNVEAMAYAVSLFSAENQSSGGKKVDAGKQTSRQSTSDLHSTRTEKSRNAVEEEAFPCYMQPDATYISGIHLSKVIARVHAMCPQPRYDMGLQFRFWQLCMQSLCFEEQQLMSDELSLRDITCHAGRIECIDYSGVCERQMLAVGSQHKFYLPFTASQVLGVSLPTILDTYAVHTRLVMRSVHDNASSDASKGNGRFADLKAGSINVRIEKSLPDELYASANEAMQILFPSTKVKNINNATNKPVKKPPYDSQHELTLMFQLSTHGGNIQCNPLFELTIPETELEGKSGADGISFNTFVEGLGVNYGHSKQRTLQKFPLCSLPETLRMHVLVFLDDLSPLEKVLQIDFKRNVSVFLRSHTINKTLSAIKDVHKKLAPLTSHEDGNRRQQLLNQLRQLDNDTLEKLLASHCKANRSR